MDFVIIIIAIVIIKGWLFLDGPTVVKPYLLSIRFPIERILFFGPFKMHINFTFFFFSILDLESSLMDLFNINLRNRSNKLTTTSQHIFQDNATFYGLLGHR